MASGPNSIFPVIFFFFLMEAGEKERRMNSAVTFSMALTLKPFKKEHSWWHPGVSRMGSPWLFHPSIAY